MEALFMPFYRLHTSSCTFAHCPLTSSRIDVTSFICPLYNSIAPRTPHMLKVMAKVTLIVTVMMSEWLVTFFCPTPTEITFSGGQRKLCSEYLIERKAQNTKSNENVTRILNRTTTQWICWILKKNITQQSWTRRRIWWQKKWPLLPKVPIFETKKMALRVAKSKF